jgi:hypothetical protein
VPRAADRLEQRQLARDLGWRPQHRDFCVTKSWRIGLAEAGTSRPAEIQSRFARMSIGSIRV